MKRAVYVTDSGQQVVDQRTLNSGWVCPRDGEGIILNGRVWQVTKIIHDYDNNEIIIYMRR